VTFGEQPSLHEIRVHGCASDAERDELTKRIARTLCPDENHPPPCPVPWSCTLRDAAGTGVGDVLALGVFTSGGRAACVTDWIRLLAGDGRPVFAVPCDADDFPELAEQAAAERAEATFEPPGGWPRDAGVRARLAQLAACDPEFKRFGAEHHRYVLGAPLAEESVAAFEERHAVRLPDAYRRFLTEVGDGGAGPYCGLLPLDRTDRCGEDAPQRLPDGFLATPFPHEQEWNDTELDDDAYFADERVAGSLQLCHMGCGHYLRLAVTGPTRGRLWLDTRAGDGGLSLGPRFEDWYADWLNCPFPALG